VGAHCFASGILAAREPLFFPRRRQACPTQPSGKPIGGRWAASARPQTVSRYSLVVIHHLGASNGRLTCQTRARRQLERPSSPEHSWWQVAAWHHLRLLLPPLSGRNERAAHLQTGLLARRRNNNSNNNNNNNTRNAAGQRAAVAARRLPLVQDNGRPWAGLSRVKRFGWRGVSWPRIGCDLMQIA